MHTHPTSLLKSIALAEIEATARHPLWGYPVSLSNWELGRRNELIPVVTAAVCLRRLASGSALACWPPKCQMQALEAAISS